MPKRSLWSGLRPFVLGGFLLDFVNTSLLRLDCFFSPTDVNSVKNEDYHFWFIMYPIGVRDLLLRSVDAWKLLFLPEFVKTENKCLNAWIRYYVILSLLSPHCLNAWNWKKASSKFFNRRNAKRQQGFRYLRILSLKVAIFLHEIMKENDIEPSSVIMEMSKYLVLSPFLK